MLKLDQSELILFIVPEWAESRVEGNLVYFKAMLSPEELEGKGTEEREEDHIPIGTSLFWGADDARVYENLCREPIKLVGLISVTVWNLKYYIFLINRLLEKKGN